MCVCGGGGGLEMVGKKGEEGRNIQWTPPQFIFAPVGRENENAITYHGCSLDINFVLSPSIKYSIYFISLTPIRHGDRSILESTRLLDVPRLSALPFLLQSLHLDLALCEVLDFLCCPCSEEGWTKN